MKIRIVAFHSALATIFKSLSAIVSIKILAVNIGPNGLGEISNSFSLIGFCAVFCIAGAGAGITKCVAMADTIDEIFSIIRVSVYISSAITIFLTSLSVIFPEEISEYVFLNKGYANLIVPIALLTFPLGLSMMTLSVLNGLRRADIISKYQLIGLIFGSLIIYWLAANFYLKGAILGLYIIPSIPVLYALYLSRSYLKKVGQLLVVKANDLIIFRILLNYSWITISSIVISTAIQFNYRSEIERMYGASEVGYWQSMIRISDGYTQVFMIFLMAYLLPNVTRAAHKLEIKKLINQVILWMTVGMVITFSLIYIFRFEIIKITLTDEFQIISTYFSHQLLSDFLRINSYIPGIIVLAFGMVKLSLLMEVLQGVLLYTFGQFFINRYGAKGAVYAYLFSYVIYFCIAYVAYFYYMHKRNARNE